MKGNSPGRRTQRGILYYIRNNIILFYHVYEWRILCQYFRLTSGNTKCNNTIVSEICLCRILINSIDVGVAFGLRRINTAVCSAYL